MRVCYPKLSHSPLSNYLSDWCLLIWKSRSNLFFPFGMCICWWTISVPEDTCRQGYFCVHDMKYFGWLRSICTLKSILNNDRMSHYLIFLRLNKWCLEIWNLVLIDLFQSDIVCSNQKWIYSVCAVGKLKAYPLFKESVPFKLFWLNFLQICTFILYCDVYIYIRDIQNIYADNACVSIFWTITTIFCKLEISAPTL